MVAKTQPDAWTKRFGRSLQGETRDNYREYTAVLDQGLHLNRDRSKWQEPNPELSMALAVQQAVRSRLPLRTDPRSYQDYEALADDYSASIAIVRAAIEDVRRFVRAIVEVNNTYSAHGAENPLLRSTFWESYYGQMTKRSTSMLIPPQVMLSAELEGMDVEVAATRLCEKLGQTVRRFSDGVAAMLAELQAVELIGRINWRIPTACDSFYYEDMVVHEHLGEEVVERSPPEDVEFDYERLVKRVRQDVKKVSKDRHVVQHGLHVKVIGKAQRSPIDRFPDVIPEHVRRFLKTTPEWLSELMEIVSGKSRTDFVVARDIFVEEREVARTHREEWYEPCYCPLVTVGDYVLTGWGAKEVQVETARQHYGWLYTLAATLVVLAAICMGLARLGSWMWGYVAPVAATLSLAMFIEASRKRAIAQAEIASIGKLLSAGLSWFLLSSGLMGLAVGVATASWLLGMASGVCVVAGGLLLRRVMYRKSKKA
ncbi:MAG: hypothetical protein ACYC0X_15615 [Pirellulaceae bacterium]